MKETIITFIVALFVGSVINGYLTGDSPVSANAEAVGGAEPQSLQPLNAEESQTVVSDATTSDLPVVNESNFQSEVIDDNQPVLVSFSRANCSHCLKMRPIVNQLAHEYAGAIKVVQADVMDNPAIAERYRIYGVPAFVIADHGKVQGPFIGEMSKSKLAGLVRAHVKVSTAPPAPRYAG